MSAHGNQKGRCASVAASGQTEYCGTRHSTPDLAVEGIWNLHDTNVESIESGFQSALSGFQVTLDANNALAEGTYNSETTAHFDTCTFTVEGIETGYNSTVAGADSLLDSA